MQAFGVVFSVISIPLAFIGLAGIFIRPDIEDGTLEILLSTISPIKIIYAKYLALCASSILSFALILPIIHIVYNLHADLCLMIFLIATILLFLSASLIMLIASIQGYFRANTNFLAILIMPLLIPNIIISGILIQNISELHLLFIMIGIDFVLIPPALYLSSYLVANIYNI
jgi:heme exporter protein B